MLKKAGLLSTCCLPSHLHPHALSSTSPPSLPPRGANQYATAAGRRGYAEIHHHKGPEFRDNMHWPAKSSSSLTPTPYEIFDLKKGAVYSKHRFFELVKIYHPDRHGLEDNPCSRDLSHGERLERYRLVILAHEILSDPVKRSAYDSYGAGWADRQRTVTRHSQGYHASGSGKPYGRGEGYDSSPFANATWEDWERWYARDAPQTTRQSYAGNYISPNMFASLVVMMAVISGAAQATRSGQHSGSLEERAQAFTEETSRFLEERAEQQRSDTLDSGGRVKWFLEKRDPSKYGLKDEEENVYKDHFLSRTILARKQLEMSDPGD